MATRTKAPVDTRTKTQRFFDLLDSDKEMTIAAAAKACDMVYSFGYGRAQTRQDPAFPGQTYAESRAKRRAERRVTTLEDGTLKIKVPQGFVLVTEDGKVSRSRK